MGEPFDHDREMRDGDCYRCQAVTGELMHLWWNVHHDGGVWTWLAESILPPVIFTPDEARELLDSWKKLRRSMRRGVRKTLRLGVSPLAPATGQQSALLFGVLDGHMTYWRSGETREHVQLGMDAFDDLIAAWEEVCAQAEGVRAGHCGVPAERVGAVGPPRTA